MEELKIYPLNEISPIPPERFSTGIYYFDNLLGGGIVAGSTMIVAGLPGSGKSTMFTQLSYQLAESAHKIVLYIAGEENKEQIKMRAERLAVNSGIIFLDEEVEIEKIIEAIDKVVPDVVIVDSMQMIYSNTLKPAPGSPSQMKYGLMTLCKIAKQRNIAIIFIGHATKGGYIAGLQTFQHMVDVVLFLGVNEDYTRFIKVNKNRFGESGISQNLYMSKYGLFDQCGIEKPFGEQTSNKETMLTESEVKKMTEGSLARPVILASVGWLKDQANLCSGTTNLTSENIDKLTEGHPIWKPLVKYSMKWLEKHATPLQKV